MPAKKLTFQAVMRWSDERCREFPVAMRRPDGIRCPERGSTEKPFTTANGKPRPETRRGSFIGAGTAGGSSPPRGEPSSRIPRFP